MRKAAETRQQHNKTISQIHALTCKKNAEQALKAIMNAETMYNMWKKIGYAHKGRAENNITSISIPDTWPDMTTLILADDKLENPKTASTWHKIDVPEEILHYLTVHNSPMSEAVLQGKFTDTELTEMQQLF
eukprot:7301012-Ditylum_brightwellii.AAC.1